MSEHLWKRRLVLLAVLVPLVEAILLLKWDTTLRFLLTMVTSSSSALAALVLGTGVALAWVGFYFTQSARLGTGTGALKVAGYWVVSQGFCWWIVHQAHIWDKEDSELLPFNEFLFPSAYHLSPPGNLLIAFFALFLLIVSAISYIVFRKVDEGWRSKFWTSSERVRWSWVTSWLVVSLGLFAAWASGAFKWFFSMLPVSDALYLYLVPPAIRELVDIFFWHPLYFVAKICTTPLFPVLVSLIWLFTLLSLRVHIGEEGVALKLAGLGFCLARVRWQKVRRIDIIRHKELGPSLVIHYWTRWKTPFSISLSSERYLDGEKMTEVVENEATKRGIHTIYRYSPDWIPRLAYAFLLLAIGLNISQFILSNELWKRYIQDVVPPTHLDILFAGIPLALLFAGSVLSFGIYLGLLSSFYRGGFRPVLAGAWVIASRGVPDPIIHWITWMVIYAIHKAQLWIHSPPMEVPIPPMSEINFALILVALGPAFAGVGYVLGVVAGCWRKPALVSAIQRPPSQKPAPVSS